MKREPCFSRDLLSSEFFKLFKRTDARFLSSEEIEGGEEAVALRVGQLKGEMKILKGGELTRKKNDPRQTNIHRLPANLPLFPNKSFHNTP